MFMQITSSIFGNGAAMVAAVLMLLSCAGISQAGITVDATTNYADAASTWTNGKDIDFSAFDPSGSEKLVAVIAGRGGSFLAAPTVTFNTQPMTHVVTRPVPAASTYRGVASIFYLDSPPSGGTLSMTYNAQIQNVCIALLALSGTATDYSGPTISTNSSASGIITTTKNGTLVVAGAWAGDLGLITLTPDSPLTSLLSIPIPTGGPASTVAAGYYEDPDAGDVAISFTTDGTVKSLVAAGFLPKPPPAGTIILIK